LLFRDHRAGPPGYGCDEWTNALEERVDVDELRSALATELAGSSREDERRFAIRALGQISPSSNVVAALVIALSDPLWDVRSDAAELLSALQRLETRDALVGALDDPHPVVRARAAAGVGRLGAWEAVDRLIDMLADPAIAVRLSAAEALSSIGQAGFAVDSRRLVAREPITIRPSIDRWVPSPLRAAIAIHWIDQLAADEERRARANAVVGAFN